MTQSKGTGPDVTNGSSLGHRLRIGGGVGAIGVLLLFFVQNLQEVEMHFLWFDWSAKMIFVQLTSAVLGAVAWWMFGVMRRRGRRTDRRD